MLNCMFVESQVLHSGGHAALSQCFPIDWPACVAHLLLLGACTSSVAAAINLHCRWTRQRACLRASALTSTVASSPSAPAPGTLGRACRRTTPVYLPLRTSSGETAVGELMEQDMA